MTKKELRQALKQAKEDAKLAIEELFAEVNKGQQKQIVKKEHIKAMFDRYGVEYEE